MRYFHWCATWLALTAIASTALAEPPTSGPARTPQTPVVTAAMQPPAIEVDPQPPLPPVDIEEDDAADAPSQQQTPLPEVPETTVVAEAEGVGSQGLPVPSSTEVTTPTRTPTSLGDVASSISVITAEQIQATEQTQLSEMLRGLPGVDVVSTGPVGSSTRVFLRGANPEHTKVLIDGIPANDAIDPTRSFDFSLLSLDNIEQIEVLRGPQSTLYGSDALGGVINITTKQGSGPPTLTTDLFGGMLGTTRESFRFGGGGCYTNYSIGGSYLDTDGFSAASDRLAGNTEADGFHLGSISARLGWTPFENFDVDFIVRYLDGTVEGDDGGGPNQDDPNEMTRQEQAYARVQFRYENLAGWWEQRLMLNLADTRRRFDDAEDFQHPNDFSIGRFHGQNRSVEWQHNLLLHDTNTLVVGATYFAEEGNSSFTSAFGPSVFPEDRLHDTGIYVEDQIQLGNRWFATAGVRQDNYSQAGVADTYRLTSLYRTPVTETGLRATYGTAFRAPSIFQLLDPQFGNPFLLPEESVGWDAGIEQPLFDQNVVLSATYFRNDFTNLVQLDAMFRPQNIGSARSTGMELSGLVILTERSTLTCSYTYTDAIDLATDRHLLRRPPHKGSVGINRSCFNGCGNVNLSAWYVGDRYDNAFDPNTFVTSRVVLDDYIVVNVAASAQLTEWCRVYGRIDNLLDEHYEEIFGFGNLPLAAYGGVSVTW